MKNNFTVCNAWICKIHEREIKPVFGDLHIENGRIIKIEKKSFEKFLKTKDSINKNGIDAKGKVVTIPQINFHEHIYSRLAKGLNISGQTNSFENILTNLWWKLDSVLDNKMIEASARMAAIESIKNGTTYLFDHHSSPNYAIGSLETISNTLNEYGLRGVLCFETTDRNGNDLTEKGLIENIDFANRTIENKNIKSMFGLHASFTIDEKTLKTVAEFISEKNIGIHIHLSEAEADNKNSLIKYGLKPIDRLIKYKLLNEKSILSHAVHLSKHDWEKIKKYNAAVAINSESNMNNSVGVNKFSEIPNEMRLLCGTDGMHANPTQTLKTIFFLMRQQGMSFELAFDRIIKIYFDQIEFAKKYFPDFGQLNIGDRADFIVWDYAPPTPINSDNFWGHFVYGIIQRKVSSVFQGGKILMLESQVTFNEKETDKEIILQGKRLFNKFNK